MHRHSNEHQQNPRGLEEGEGTEELLRSDLDAHATFDLEARASASAIDNPEPG